MTEQELELLSGAAEEPAQPEKKKRGRRKKDSAPAPLSELYVASKQEYETLVAELGLPAAWLLLWPDSASLVADEDSATATMAALLVGVRKMKRQAA